MRSWPEPIKPYTPDEIRQYLTDPTWMTFVVSLDPLTTEQVLDRLWARRDDALTLVPEGGWRRIEVQHDSYLFSLIFSGRLNGKLEVVNDASAHSKR